MVELTYQVVKDDGPPSAMAPYFRPFVEAMQSAGHQVFSVIPEKAVSWIGKAHTAGKALKLSEFCHELR